MTAARRVDGRDLARDQLELADTAIEQGDFEQAERYLRKLKRLLSTTPILAANIDVSSRLHGLIALMRYLKD